MLALAGCGGGGRDEAAEAADPPTGGAVATMPDPEPGRVLARFVAAGRRGDADALWSSLSRPTRGGFSGSLARFRRGGGRTLIRTLRPVRPPLRVVLSQRIGRRWAVAVVAGERAEDDRIADFAFAGAFRREAGRWRIDLGGVVVGGVRPEPQDEVGRDVLLRADTAAGGRVATFLLWLDGQPIPAGAESETPFAARVRAQVQTLRPGLHVGAAFAATADSAGAVAWPFRVEDSEP